MCKNCFYSFLSYNKESFYSKFLSKIFLYLFINSYSKRINIIVICMMIPYII
nr:MAG TPA: hypothetical protein [Caudoviricetes sp.]